jgi:hypothetical protein
MQVALHKARLVLKYKPLLAAEVLSGMLLLDPAYKDAMAEVLVHLREAPECTNDAQDADGLLLA